MNHYVNRHMLWTYHSFPVPNVVDEFILQREELHTGVQDQLCVQAHFPQHSQQQQQLIITVGPWTEAHTHRKILKKRKSQNHVIHSRYII